MASQDTLLDILLLLFCIIFTLLVNSLIQGIGHHWAAIISIVILFSLLYGCAERRAWTVPFRLPVVGSSLLSELFLGLTLMTTALAISWFLGVVISRMVSEVEGVLVSLCIFGMLMLMTSSVRNWH
jgi:hypothetical protein